MQVFIHLPNGLKNHCDPAALVIVALVAIACGVDPYTLQLTLVAFAIELELHGLVSIFKKHA